MTVTIDLNPEVEKELLAQARERGMSLSDYLQEIVAGQAPVSMVLRSLRTNGLSMF